MYSLFLSLQRAPVKFSCKYPCSDRFGRQLSHTVPLSSTMETRKSLIPNSMKKPGQTVPSCRPNPSSRYIHFFISICGQSRLMSCLRFSTSSLLPTLWQSKMRNNFLSRVRNNLLCLHTLSHVFSHNVIWLLLCITHSS